MKNFFPFLLVSFLIFAFGCTKNNEDLIKLDEEFTLAFQKEVTLKKTDLRIEFVEVLEDSRCPSDAICGWAGVVKVNITITEGEKETTLELLKPGQNIEGTGSTVSYDSYQIQLIKVTPYPKTTTTIKPSDYEAILKISAQ